MYTYPSVVINDVTYTARRWGQFPTITYDTSNEDVTAGNEIVVVATDLSNITVYIEDGASTNQNIADAINNWDGTTQSLYPRDLVSVAIAEGEEGATNTDEGPDAMTGARVDFTRVDIPALPDPIFVMQVFYGPNSFQAVSADMVLDANAGSDDGSDPKYLAAAMFNIFGDELANDANYLAGVIGAYSITGTKASSYPSGAVLAQITDGVTEVDGAVVAYIDGDGSQTNAGAAFTVRNNNSTPGSGFDFGLDLMGPARDGYPAVEYLVAEMRFSNGTKVTVDGDDIIFTSADGSKSATITMTA